MPVLSILYRYYSRAIPCTTNRKASRRHTHSADAYFYSPCCFPLACIGRHFHLTFSRVVGSRCKGFSSSSPHAGKRSRLPRTLVVTKKSMHKKKSYATCFSYSGLARQLQTLASQVSGGLGITVFARRNVASFGAVALWSRGTAWSASDLLAIERSNVGSYLVNSPEARPRTRYCRAGNMISSGLSWTARL